MLEQLGRNVFCAGEHIFEEGDHGDCAYIIEQGCVEVYVMDKGVRQKIGVVSTGEMFGEVALIDHKPRTASAMAVEKTVLIPIQRNLVEGLLERTDPIVRHLLLIALERYRARPSSATQKTAAQANQASQPEIAKRRESLRGEATQKLALAHDITYALTNNEFVLHYQPICELSTGRIAGYEALIRWNHPRNGMVSPLDFLWLAERTGLIHEIGLWTLNRACTDWSALRQRTDYETPFVSINMSPSQLTGDSFVEDYKSVISRHKIPPAELKFELLETVIINDPDVALQLLNRMRELGSSLALDDFGTGHSGLESLQRYPISTMKIDRAFINTMNSSLQSREIVSSSIKLAHSLGMDVVAEGIETDDVRLNLLDLKCNFGQGWHFGRPTALKSAPS